MVRKSRSKISQVEMWGMYCQGYSLNEIGAEAGLTGEMVRKLVKVNPQYQQVKQQRKLNKYNVDSIKDLITAGKTKKEIEEILKLSHTQLVIACKHDPEIDQIFQSENMNQHTQDRELIWQLHQQGLTYIQIASQLGRSVTYIDSRIKEHPKYRTKEQRKGDKGTLIRFLLLSGYSVETVAEQLGHTRRTIKKYLK